jgi:ethanolamine ammonia-lyase small subunit
MKQLIPAFAFSLLVSCTGHGRGTAAGSSPGDPGKMPLDTEKLKQDIGNVIKAMDGQHPPDTNVLKAAASDVLTTDADVLSDSGIDQLGDKNDPAAKAAQDALKKMRNAMGLTPAKLDSIRKAGASLKSGGF